MSSSFSIKETVNKNIEKNQFPSFSNYFSMVGWCSMNYPKNLVNPIYLDKQEGVPDARKYELDSLFQKKNPIQRQKKQFIKPLTNLAPDDKNQDKQSPTIIRHNDSKISSHTLATTSHPIRSKIFEENNKMSEEYSAVLPLANYLGSNYDGNFSRKIRQIGEVTYTPHFDNEEMRHLKKLPKTVIDEQNLMEILNPSLQYLNLEYKTEISNDLIDKIGYLAPNIKSLNLTALKISSKVLVELGKSCKQLENINISKCYEIEEFALISFLKDIQNLKEFSANHLKNSFTDACLECLKEKQHLKCLEINFCEEITSQGFQFLDGKAFQKLGLANLKNLKNADFMKVFMSSVETLKEIDISFNNIPQINNALMAKLGMCTKLQTVILTGCQKVTDEGINNLVNGQKGRNKQPEGFANLRVLKLGGLLGISDQLHNVFKKCPVLSFIEANNLQRLTDSFLDHLKGYPGPKTILLNFTPNISDEKIKEISESHKHIKLIRTILKVTDPSDDGLRMPIPPASLKIKKPKKKKK